MEAVLLFLGIITAMLHGTGFPITMLIFGGITDAFIDQAITASTVSSNETLHLCLQSVLPDPNKTAEVLMENAATGFVDCDAQFNLGNSSSISLEDLIPACYGEGRTCLGNSAFIDEIANQCYIYVGIASAMLLLSYIQVLLFQLVSAKIVHQIRLKFYRAVLRQDIGWFDANPGGELSSRILE